MRLPGAFDRDDAPGVLLTVALGIWAVVVQVLVGGESGGILVVLASGVAALAVGRVAAKEDPRLPAILVLVAGVVLVLLTGVLQQGPLGGPFGYSNATGAFYAQVAAAGFVLAAMAQGPVGRVLWLVAGLAAAAVPVHLGVQAGWVTAALALGGLAWPWLVGGRGIPVARLGLGVVGVGYVATVVAGLVGGTAVFARRVALWGDALDLLAADVLLGNGPGRFPLLSPTAVADRDTPFAHNELLEMGAELGVIGLALAIGLVVWWFHRLGRTVGPATPVAVGAAVGLWLNAAIDYPLHYPAVVAAAVLVLTTASARGSR